MPLDGRECGFVPVVPAFLRSGTESHCLGSRFQLEFALVLIFEGDAKRKIAQAQLVADFKTPVFILEIAQFATEIILTGTLGQAIRSESVTRIA